MADKDKPEETTEKKKGLLGGSKVPLDAVLLVVAPFVTFVMLFMYVMGLLPPRPMTVKVVGAAPMEQAQMPAAGAPAANSPTPPIESAGDLMSGVDTEGRVDMASVPAEPADSVPKDAGGRTGPGPEMDESASEAAAMDMDDQSTAEIAEVDEERMERIKQLAKVYEQMNASSVAAIITNMGDDDAVDILSYMKPRNAAQVLASLEPEKAAKLSLRLTE